MKLLTQHKKDLLRYFVFRYFELVIWFVALVLLAFMSPDNDHFSLCPLKNAGFSFCPGCGLGHSISYFFRGEVLESFHSHPLGLFAITILLMRIFQLLKSLIYGSREDRIFTNKIN